MKKCKVLEYFTLKKFNELENIVRADENNNTKNGELFVGDTFDCTDEMAEYLTGKNNRGMIVVKVIGDIEEKNNDIGGELFNQKIDEIENYKKKKKHGKK